MPDFAHEKALGHRDGRIVVGIDEAGRGPWAGPVVAGVALLEARRLSRRLRQGLDDSKKLTPARREELFVWLQGEARVAVGLASVEEIDRINILQATLLAMRRAYDALGLAADHALVDGNCAPALPCAVATLVDGDGLSLSIAAASIVAKVTRDRLMSELCDSHPGYGWRSNKGYGTEEHRLALLDLGVSAQHRRSFRPVRELLSLTA